MQNNRNVLFKMLVRPRLVFCSFIYSNATRPDIKRIENVQRRFTKHVLRYPPHMPYHDRCKTLNIQPLWPRRLKINLPFMLYIIHNISFSKRILCFNKLSSHHLRNSYNVLKIIGAKRSLRSRFFLIRYRTI